MTTHRDSSPSSSRRLLAVLAGAMLAVVGVLVWASGDSGLDEFVQAGAAGDRGAATSGRIAADDRPEDLHRDEDPSARTAAAIAPAVPVPKPHEVLVRVLDAETGAPVAGATVCADDPNYRYQRLSPEQKALARQLVGAFSRSFHLGQRTVSDEGGHALLRSDNYMQVHARLGDRHGTAHVQDARETEVVEVRLADDPSIVVQVVDATGRPLEGVPIGLGFEALEPGAQVGSSISDLAGHTDGEGRLQIRELAYMQAEDTGLVYRNLRVFVHSYGLAQVSAPATPRCPPGDPVVLQLQSWGSARLVLKEAAGKPVRPDLVDGAVLNLLQRGAVTEPEQMHALVQDGAIEYPYLGLGQPLLANFWHAAGSCEHSFTGPVAHGERLVVDVPFEVRETPTASGRLLADADMLAKVDWVAVRRAADDEHVGWCTVQPDGAFRWAFDPTDLDASGKVRFVLASSSDASAFASSDVVVVPPALKQVELGDVALVPLVQVAAGRLVVQDQAMRPRARLSVEVLQPDGDWDPDRNHRAVLAEDGAFAVHAVKADATARRRLRVSNREFEPIEPVEFRLGQEDLRIELVRSARLDVRVLFDAGLARGEHLTVEAGTEALQVEGELELRDGAFFASMRGLRPGEVTVRVLLGERELGRVERVVVTPQGTKDPRLDPLDLRGKVHGLQVRLLDTAGTVADLSASVRLRVPPEQEWHECDWMEHGVFRTLVPSTQVELLLLSHEFRPIHWSGPVGNLDLRTEAPLEVEFVLDGVDATALRPDLLLSSELEGMPRTLAALGLDEGYWLHDSWSTRPKDGRVKGRFTVEGAYRIRLVVDKEDEWEVLHAWQVEVKAAQPTVRLTVPAELVPKLRVQAAGR